MTTTPSPEERDGGPSPFRYFGESFDPGPSPLISGYKTGFAAGFYAAATHTLEGSPTNEHSDLRAYREGAAAYAPSKENPMPMPKPDPFEETEATIPDRSPHETDQIYVSKLIKPSRRKEALHFRIEVDPDGVSGDDRPCYKVLLPATTSRVSQPPETRLREADVVEHLTRQQNFVELAHQELSKRHKETQDKLSRIGEELDAATANLRGLVQVRNEFISQLKDRAEREAEAKRTKYRPSEPPRAESVWRPTLVTFVKREKTPGGLTHQVRHTAVREMRNDHWTVGGQPEKFTWDELLDWIHAGEDDPEAVVRELRYQQLNEAAWHRLVKGLGDDYVWVEVRRR